MAKETNTCYGGSCCGGYYRSGVQEISDKTPADSRVTFVENHVCVAAQKIREMGYGITDHYGFKIQEPEEDYIGILRAPRTGESSPEGFRSAFLSSDGLDSLLSKIGKTRGIIPGEIHFNCKRLNATFKNWVLQVYGRENVPEMMDIAKRLSESGNVDIQVLLQSEVAKKENLR